VTIKGYVVRGTDHEGERCAAYVWQDGHDEMDALSSDEHTVFMEFARADRARGMMWVRCCTGVRIFAVADDGTETALPTYEEALAQVERLAARIEAMLEDPEGVDALSDECAAAVDAEANRAWWRTCNTHKGTDAERHEAARLASRAVYQKARRAMIDAWARGEQKGPQS
jgi:hypothetical protein